MIFVVLLLGVNISALFMNTVKIKKARYESEYSTQFISFSFYVTAVLSILAFLVNYIRVLSIGGIEVLFINPRLYELTFGANSVINYIYFLNVPSLIFLLLKKRYGYIKKIDLLIALVLVLISIFHGIKFTIFDTVIIPALFSILSLNKSNKINLSKYFKLFTPMIGVFLVFNQFVRGSSGKLTEAFLGYILPSYVNLLYSVSIEPVSFNFVLKLFWPSLIQYPLTDISIMNPVGFMLNPKYNMPTGILIMYETFNYLGLIFIPLILMLISKFLMKNRHKNIVYMFTNTMFHYCLLFLFWSWSFTKIKYIYYVVFFILWSFSHSVITRSKKIRLFK
jgi:oligosaccharide repeat unit polymerase